MGKAAAERGFFRAIKEFRQLQRESKASGAAASGKSSPSSLGSFLPEPRKEPAAEKPAPTPPRPAPPTAPKPASTPSNALAMPPMPASVGVFDLPFTIGRAC